MASLSVKDRAKMFGNLASPNDTGKDRTYRNVGSIGNKVSSSPFRSAPSPKTNFSPPFSSGSPNVSRSATVVGSQNLSGAFSKQVGKKNDHGARNNDMDWPDEDGIPAPSPMEKKFAVTGDNLPPVTLPMGKFSNNSSPFKVINNQKVQGKLPTYTYGKVSQESKDSSIEKGNTWEKKFQSQKTVTTGSAKKEKKVEASINAPVESKNPSPDLSNSDQAEDAPQENESSRNKPTRAERLLKAKRASPSPSTIVSKNLKQSLQAANVVMQEEKSDAGASDASTRSSLSNKELSNIAKRALLNSVTASKERKTIESGAGSNLSLKASRVLAIKNSTKARATRNADVVKTVSTHSNDSSRSRRIEHPAFAGRQVKTNISSSHMMSSFHQLKKIQQAANQKLAVNKGNDDFEETYSDEDSLRSLEQEEDTMHSGRGMPGESMHSRSIHSTSGKMGKIQFTRNNCNDTVISSLSGNTQSLQSVPSKMMSPKSKNPQRTQFLLEPTPEDPSHSKKSDLLGMNPTPSNRSGHSFANSIMSASPRADYRSPSVAGRPNNTSFLDTLQESHSSGQESAGNSAELLDAALATAVEDMDIIDSPRTNPSAFSEGNTTLQILSSSSTGCSNSPPGFVFKDTEESEHMVPPNQDGKSSIEKLENSEKTPNQAPEPSTSTKRTVSTSIRSGMSSIQNGGDVQMTDRETNEGSTSIRTGLSGIQSQRYSNDMENSISIHTTVPSEDKETNKVEGPTKYPDTIQEEKSVLTKDDSSFSGLKVKATATTATDRSSGVSDQTSSDPSGVDGVQVGSRPVQTNGIAVPQIQTEGNEEASNTGFSLLTPGSRSSRAWQNGIGRSIGNALKNVLAKASPRNSVHETKQEENDEGGSLFEDDDDDIFGGLEVEPEQPPAKPATTKKKKLDEQTPSAKDPSSSRRTSVSRSHRTDESFARRANGSVSRRTNQSKSRKSTESGSTRMMRTGGVSHPSPTTKVPKTPSQQPKRTGLTPSSRFTPKANDRSGMIVDESKVVHNVNSDITSSLIGGPISGKSPFHKAAKEASKFIDPGAQKVDEKEFSQAIPGSGYSKDDMGGSFTKFMEEPDASTVDRKTLEPTVNEARDDETMHILEGEEETKPLGSMFLNFGCGLVDSCGGFAGLCAQGDKAELVAGRDDSDDKDAASVSPRSELTSLEKKVWNEWDRLNVGGLGPKTANEPSKEDTKAVDVTEKVRQEARERLLAARDKLLNIANTETEVSDGFEKSTLIGNEEGTKTTASEGASLSASASTDSESESRFSKESDFGNSMTSGESLETMSRGTYSSGSYSSGAESDAMSEDPSHSGASRGTKTSTGSGPILLSFSQRSLMEKFSKQLTAVGVEVLKLNTRKQWQTRYFTVSNEQIALSAHEAISKTGELAQCPKALLWLKKFNPKNGGYGIVNIDKNGHGGMMLVDLVDIQVSENNDDTLDNPIPKKLLDRFEKSALVTLKYKMKGILRSIEFRCRDNDEAQFLCTCMRVIRDLLRRERSLRQKLSRQASTK